MDIPHQEVVFLEEIDPTMGRLKAKGVGELGISGAAPAVANAIYNATGIRVRQYPITLDKGLNMHQVTADLAQSANAKLCSPLA